MGNGSEVCLVTTYKRAAFLHCCLRRIREIESNIEIHVFPDRDTFLDVDTMDAGSPFGVTWHYVPNHSFYGNSMNTMEAFRWAYEAGYERVYLIEDDVMVRPDFFTWHREQHEEFHGIFASMAWVFNHHAPIVDAPMFQQWYYSIGTCFPREKLALIVKHACVQYYVDMPGYIARFFPDSKLKSPFGVEHYEQDGLIQRVLERDRSQTVSSGIARCSHVGTIGYNRGWDADFFEGCANLQDRIARVEAFIADPYLRMAAFGRAIVEREIGHPIPKRVFKYRLSLPGGWTVDFESEQEISKLPKRLLSVNLTEEATLVIG